MEISGDERQKLDFGYKNIALILFVAAVLAWAAFLQSPSKIKSSSALSFAGYSSALDSTKPEYAFGARPPARSEIADAIDFSKGALKPSIDGTMLATGAVLGATTTNPEILDLFSDIKIKTITDNSGVAVQTYAQQLMVVYENDRAADLFISPTTKELAERQMKFISDLKALAVPSSLSDYHKLLVGYYGYSFIKLAGSKDADVNIIAALPDVKIQLDLIRQSTQTSSGVILPETIHLN